MQNGEGSEDIYDTEECDDADTQASTKAQSATVGTLVSVNAAKRSLDVGRLLEKIQTLEEARSAIVRLTDETQDREVLQQRVVDQQERLADARRQCRTLKRQV